MNNRVKLLLAASFATVIGTAAPAALAADAIRLVGGYEKQIHLPAKLAESLGYFKARAPGEVELVSNKYRRGEDIKLLPLQALSLRAELQGRIASSPVELEELDP